VCERWSKVMHFHTSIFPTAGSESDQIVLTRKNGQNLGIQIMTRK